MSLISTWRVSKKVSEIEDVAEKQLKRIQRMLDALKAYKEIVIRYSGKARWDRLERWHDEWKAAIALAYQRKEHIAKTMAFLSTTKGYDPFFEIDMEDADMLGFTGTETWDSLSEAFEDMANQKLDPDTDQPYTAEQIAEGDRLADEGVK